MKRTWPARGLLGPLVLSAFLLGTPRAGAAKESLAHPHRFVMSLAFGFGSASMDSFHRFAEDVRTRVVNLNPGLNVGTLSSSFQINTEIGFRYYFPYHLMVHAGIGAIYNRSSAPVTAGGFSGGAEYHNLVLELPTLVGGYLTLLDRIYLYGAVGPTFFFYGRSFWDTSGQLSSGLPDYTASGGVGFTFAAGADFVLTRVFGLGLELRYRYLKPDTLREKNSGAVVSPASLGVGTSTDPYDLDFSGISLGISLRFFLY